MRWARVLLLVLLAMMLPVRGVMAAAMLCPPDASGATGAHAMASSGHGDHDHAHADGSEASAVDHGAHHADGAASHGHHPQDGAPATDTCHLCSACCSVPPLPSTAPALPLPHGTATTLFPSWTAPAPTFQSEGPERPPRST